MVLAGGNARAVVGNRVSGLDMGTERDEAKLALFRGRVGNAGDMIRLRSARPSSPVACIRNTEWLVTGSRGRDRSVAYWRRTIDQGWLRQWIGCQLSSIGHLQDEPRIANHF